MLPRFRLAALFATAAMALHAQPPPLTAVERDRGQRLFETHCAACHGPHGEGAKGPTLAQPSLPRATDDEALLTIIREGINNTEMPRARLEPDELPLVAAYVKSLGQLAHETVPGHAPHGEQLYATKGACAQCHTLRGHGGAIGPDLTGIGRKRSAAYLRRALVEPTAEVPQSFSPFRGEAMMTENFVLVRARTRDRREYTGVRVNEDTFSIQLRDLSGALHSFFKSELAALDKDWGQSPMPSYAGVFAADEIDDVVAFLVSLRGPPAPPAEKPAVKLDAH
jgi:cytochrome c oxidase cbb3-type subunit III